MALLPNHCLELEVVRNGGSEIDSGELFGMV
jgi:hypothetical protein